MRSWGTFAKPLAPRGSSGIMRAVNQNKFSPLIGRQYRPTLAEVYTEWKHSFWQYLYFKKRNRDIDVQQQSSFVQKYLFYMCTHFGWLIRMNTEVMLLWSQKHVVQLESLYSPTSCLTIKVNFDKIQFGGYCIYRPNSFLWWKHIVFTSKSFGVFRYSS